MKKRIISIYLLYSTDEYFIRYKHIYDRERELFRTSLRPFLQIVTDLSGDLACCFLRLLHFYFSANNTVTTHTFTSLAFTTLYKYIENTNWNMEPVNKHIFKGGLLGKPKKKDYNKDATIACCYDYLLERASKPCMNIHDYRLTKCTCLAQLAVEENTDLTRNCARYLADWYEFNNTTKKEVIHGWHSYATMDGKKKGQLFLLPQKQLDVEDESDGEENTVRVIKLCRNGLANILNVGSDLWNSAVKAPAKKHGNTGKKNKSKGFEEAKDSLNAFFERLKDEAAPFPTKLIRSETGNVVRYDNPDEVALPPHYSKHRCYARWCWERGWIVTKKNSTLTIYNPVEEYEKRPHDDDDDISLWPTGSEPQKVVNWCTFFQHWQKHFGHIIIRKKGEDTCTDCTIMHNGIAALQDGDLSDVSDDDSDSDDNSESKMVRAARKKKAAYRRKAAAHVVAYITQRDTAKVYISKSISDVLPSISRPTVLTIDMGQNLLLPNLGANQVGDAYYLSPLSVFLFGVTQRKIINGKVKTLMNAYVWRESEGARGMANIASCLFLDFKRKGFFSNPQFGPLVILADNCGGQNKNKVIIRLAMWLVEAGIFPKVIIHFFVVGHTKNDCDRMFNALKRDYNRCDTTTYPQLIQRLDTHADVTPIVVEENDMKNFDKWQNQFYRSPNPGKKDKVAKDFSRTHVFSIEKNDPTVLVKEDYEGAPKRTENLMPTNKGSKALRLTKEQRAARISLSAVIEDFKKETFCLKARGISDIKLVEIHTKWVKIIPRGHALLICPAPPPEVYQKIKEERNEKARSKREVKRKIEKDSTAGEPNKKK